MDPGEPDQGLALLRVGQFAGHHPVPDRALRLGRRHGGPGLDRGERARGGRVGALGLGDLGLPGTAGRHQRSEQLPAQVRGEVQPGHGAGAVHEGRQAVQLRRGARVQGERLDELQLVVRAVLGLRDEAPQTVGRRDPHGLGLVLGQVQADRRRELAQQRLHHGRVPLVADVGQDEVDEPGGGGLAVAHGVPGRPPQQRARQRAVHILQTGGRGLPRGVVEAQLGVGQVVVVGQDHGGTTAAGGLGDLGHLTGHVEFEALGAGQAAGGLVHVVEAHSQAVGAEHVVAGRRR